jgi:hypothetical protein
MSTLHSIYGKPIEDIIESIRIIVAATEPQQQLYVSIGGKLNDKHVYFDRPMGISNTRYNVNSMEQMVPTFIRDQTIQTFVIVVDNFNSKPVYDLNISLLRKFTNPNITILLVHHYFTETSLQLFVRYLADLANANNISPKRFMVCNYVKYNGDSTLTEYRDEQMIPDVIQDTLDNTEYSECFYDWFGYNFYVYDFVYKYKTCQYLGNPPKTLETFIYERYSRVTTGVIVIQERPLLQWITNIYDITKSQPRASTKMAWSVCDTLIRADRLMSPLLCGGITPLEE